MRRDYPSVLVRRWWVAALALVVMFTVAALLWNMSPLAPHTYLATRELRVVVLPPESGSVYATYPAQQQADAIGRDLASNALLSSGAFAVNLQRTLPPGSSAAILQHSLRASQRDNLVTLSVSAGSAAQAAALADAVAQALAALGAAAPLPDGVLDGASARVDVVVPSASVVEDVGDERARAGMILTRGALAALAILLVVGALAAAGARGSGEGDARRPAIRVETSSEP